MKPAQQYTISFKFKKKVALDTFSFYFTRPERFNFIPGQYNRWTLPVAIKDGRGSSRFFTISSSLFDKDYLIFTTKIVQSEYKKSLLELQKGDKVTIFGPMGIFTFEKKPKRTKILLAGGIGITPYISKILSLAEKNKHGRIFLLASFSSYKDIIYYDELKKIEKKCNNITIIYTISQPDQAPKNWNGEKGRISKSMIKKYVSDFKKSIFYVVGPPKMEEAMKILLTRMRITEENIITEQFTGY